MPRRHVRRGYGSGTWVTVRAGAARRGQTVRKLSSFSKGSRGSRWRRGSTVAAFTSDGGVLLLREAAERTGLRRFPQCFTDHRDPDLIEHSVEKLVE